jgi:AhpD family alkylhydroperoxidase
MEQVLVYLKNKNCLKLCVLPTKQRELVALGRAILSGNKRSIEKHVAAALDAGATQDNIMEIVAYIMKDSRLLKSIIELARVLNYEENRRAPHISILDDVRE